MIQQRLTLLLYIALFSKSLNPTQYISPPGSVGSALGLKSKGRSFDPAVNHTSNNVRLLAHVFTDEDPQTEWLKRDGSNRVSWFQTRFLSWVYL